MMTGSGRLNAGELTEELRRLYIPSKKYGEVNPLIYYIVVRIDIIGLKALERGIGIFSDVFTAHFRHDNFMDGVWKWECSRSN